MFPTNGMTTQPIFITRIEDRNGNVIKRFDYSTNRKEVMSEITAYKMVKMMEGVVTQGTAASLMYRLGATEMGGKTGTTNDNADAWFDAAFAQLIQLQSIPVPDGMVYLPASVAPVGLTRSRLPCGLQIVGAFLHDVGPTQCGEHRAVEALAGRQV